MKKTVRYISIVLFSFFLSKTFAGNKISRVNINHIVYHVAVMDTEQKREQGLSGKDKLVDHQGMLFVFEQKDRYSFWMKDMKFSIDIIFIDNNKIVDIFHSVPIPKPFEKLSQLPLYTPAFPANYVLEVNAGDASKYGFKVGEGVGFS